MQLYTLKLETLFTSEFLITRYQITRVEYINQAYYVL